MSNPANLVYTKEHLWINKEEGTVGITDYAQESLGDILFVDLPSEGDSFEAGEQFSELESSKTTVELKVPFDGEVVEANEKLDDDPEDINDDAFAAWIAKFNINSDIEGAMTAEEYEAFVETLD